MTDRSHPAGMSTWSSIAADISAATNEPFEPLARRSVGGGCINSAYVLEGAGCRYFVKTNSTSALEMFAAEAEGLRALLRSAAVRVPRPVCAGAVGATAYLVMEYIQLGGAPRRAAQRLGCQLADLHRTTADRFGWHRENTIGSTPQRNNVADDWTEFWRTRRLGYQLDLAAGGGHGGRLQRKGERLLADMDAFFASYRPEPSLLHGDLWSGNYAADEAGEPVLYDPATYFGDRETDLAMTELFGGFPAEFYAAYGERWPLDPGYESRRTLYNLYHILNHLNLFGGGYAAQAERMLDSLLSDLA